MDRKRIILYLVTIIIVVGVLGIGVCAKYNIAGRIKVMLLFPRSKELPIEDIVPRDITSEISAMKEWEQRIELPKDKEMTQRAQNALQTAREFWNECQELVNSGKIKISYWNGLYSANWKSDNKKETIFLVFISERGEIRQCQKQVFADETYKTEIKEKGCQLKFYDNNDYLEWYHRRNGNEGVRFYPNNKIESFFYKSADGTTHSCSWDQESKIIREQIWTHTKPNSQ